jgi:tRNA G37 N-methylase Trm5
MKNVIAYGHALLKEIIKKDDLVIDMTAGNGNDTLFLAQCSNHVLAFDILKEAIDQTRKRLDDHGIHHVTLIQDSHEYIRKYLKIAPKAFIFNLGYLPGFDKTLTTMTQSTLMALKESIELLKEEGLIVITLYPGHQEGQKEALAIESYLKSLPAKRFTVTTYKVLNRALAPFNITIYKHKGVLL